MCTFIFFRGKRYGEKRKAGRKNQNGHSDIKKALENAARRVLCKLQGISEYGTWQRFGILFERDYQLDDNRNKYSYDDKLFQSVHGICIYCRNCSLAFRLGELVGDVHSVFWRRDALYSHYPENHIARDCGTALKQGAVHTYDDADMRNIIWEQDMSAFAYYERSSKYNQLASNDFRTKRLKIRKYLVNMENDRKILLQTDCDNINAYVNPFHSKLQISKGYYTPSILWGNYWGKRFTLNSKNTFAFSVSLGEQD